jgi:hypothetical protein
MLTLEDILTGHAYADLPASPLQLAIARAADGRPLGNVLPPAAMRAHFGLETIAKNVPALVVIVAGVRGGKSFLSACAGIKGALTADLSKLCDRPLRSV